ncbi:MAG: phosphoribosylamine--glycine ligase, partial [Candidatus Altarchaeaceae archaeon]
NGAREHAIAEYIVKFGYNLYSFINAKNPGIVKISKEYKIGNILNKDEILKFAKEKNITIGIIGPEAPLEAGVSNALTKEGIFCISPSSELARIETRKDFAREILKKYKINAYPEFEIFKLNDEKDLEKFIKEIKNVAVKPVGLTGGKGVKVVGKQLKDENEAIEYAKEILKKDKIVLIEERLEGEEFTLQAFSDGKNISLSPLVQDHKAAYEDDKGPNTGGMGSYSDKNHLLPFLTERDLKESEEILKRTIDALRNECGEYIGILYGQFMATKDGVKVVEFNARFGDPEAINVLPLLNEDFIEKIYNKKLGNLKFENYATVCKYLVPNGYPENPVKTEIFVDEEKIKELGARIYYASVYEENGKIYSTHSRAIALLGIAENIEDAEKISENATKFVKGNLRHRKDIGTKQLIEKRIKHMKEIRNF